MSIDSNEKKPKIIARHLAISFTNEDFEGVDKNLDDPMIISIVAANFFVKVFVDQGSSADLLYLSTLRKMGTPEMDLKPFHGNLIGFSGEQLGVTGYIDLLTSFGTALLVKTISIRYLVIDY